MGRRDRSMHEIATHTAKRQVDYGKRDKWKILGLDVKNEDGPKIARVD